MQGHSSPTPGHVRPHLNGADPAYKPLICRTRPTTRTVKVWTEEASSALQDCFECTDWEVFQRGRRPGGLHISCSELCAVLHRSCPTFKFHQSFFKPKPWIDSTAPLLKDRDAAYRSDDRMAYRKELQRASSWPNTGTDNAWRSTLCTTTHETCGKA